ncbi:hypothetical protein NBE98_01710 [Clostridium swellfunianum]|uniref:hypothetical protein n=1 Tax=Clostridium swellfunianum TaxID=1367462 RepID=UPI00202EC525|nr:hypothetical protein [Clostridium swellfunianum]MCM0647086.1 hypothetical protein [Clostridium swellfunianum]
MSRKHYKCEQNNLGGLFGGSRTPSLPTLIILILILLQFNGGNLFGKGGYGKGGFESVDNGILFIIALFYLSCCNPCKSECC